LGQITTYHLFEGAQLYMPMSHKSFKRPEYIAFMVTFVFGLAVHLFALTNVLHNHDDIAAYPVGLGTGISSGRWFLEILDRWFIHTGGGYNLAYLNGFLFILFIAMSSFLVVSVLQIKKHVYACLIGASFVVFPSAVSILIYRFGAHINGFAVFLAVLSVWLIGKFRFSWLISAVLMALSLGIYQAYFPLAVSICVMLIIKQLLEGDGNCAKACFIRGLCFCGVLILGLVMYLAAQKFFMNMFGSELSGYRGMEGMFNYKISQLPALIYEALRSFLLMPLRDYCDIANIASIRKAYMLTELVTLVLLLICTFAKKRSFWDFLVLLLVCAAFPVAVNLIVLLAPGTEIYTMMVYSFVSILWLPLVLSDILRSDSKALHIAATFLKNCAAALVLLIVLSYSYHANVNYSSEYVATRQAENYMNALVVQVRMTEGFDADKKWAFVGEVNDPLMENRWSLGARYGGNILGPELINNYSKSEWIRLYFGYAVPFASADAIEQVKTSDEYKSMPYWPAEGSIKVIDDLVVIKFSD